MVIDLDTARRQKAIQQSYMSLDLPVNSEEQTQIYNAMMESMDNLNAQLNQRKQEYIKQNTGEWAGLGELYKTDRIKAGLSRYKVAHGLFISPGRLKRFEEGEPVRDSKLIARCYSLFLQQL